jgi:hypothetical protein
MLFVLFVLKKIRGFVKHLGFEDHKNHGIAKTRVVFLVLETPLETSFFLNHSFTFFFRERA